MGAAHDGANAVPAMPPPRRWSWRANGSYLLQALGLCGLAVTQPVLDLLSHTPELFVFRGATSVDIVLLVLAIALVPALCLSVIAGLVGAVVPGQRAAVASALLGVVATGLVLVWTKELTGIRGPVAMAVAVLGGGAFAVAHRRYGGVASWTRYLALATPVFVGLALLQSPLAPLVRSGDVEVADVATDRTPPIVLVVLDELPTSSLVDGDGRIDGDLYPNLAGFAADATWYRNHSSVSTTTVYAVPGLLTGRYPVDGTTPTAADHPQSLFTLLGGTYDVRAAETWTRLCPGSVCGDVRTRSGPGLLVRDVVRTWWDLAAPDDDVADPVGSLIETAEVPDTGGQNSTSGVADVVDADVDAFVDGLSPDGPPTLHYLHALTPHQPWRVYPSGRQYASEDETYGRPFVDQWVDEEWAVTLGRQRHLLQAGHSDALVGRVLDRLRDTGLYDRSLVVITADHGIGFEPGALSRGDGPDEPVATWSDLIGVPLLVKEPGQRVGVVVDDNIQSIDLLPTIADLLDVDLPFDVDGTSALAVVPRPATKTYFQARVDWGARRTVAGAERVVDAEEAHRRILARGLDSYRRERAGPLDLYRVGPAAHLVGRTVDEVDVGPPSELGVTAASDAIDVLDGVTLEGLVTGVVRGPGAREATIVTALDGVITGGAEPFPTLDHDAVVVTLVPEPLLGSGSGQLGFYELDGDVLRPVEVAVEGRG